MRHRPRHLLWLNGRYVSLCSCHWFETVRFDRPLPGGAK